MRKFTIFLALILPAAAVWGQLVEVGAEDSVVVPFDKDFVEFNLPLIPKDEKSTLTSVKSSCGCTDVRLTRMPSADKSGAFLYYLAGTYTRSKAQQASAVTFTIKGLLGNENRVQRINVKFYQEELVEIKPRVVLFSKANNDYEKPKSVEISVRNLHVKSVTIAAIKGAEGDAFCTYGLRSDNGKVYTLEISPKSGGQENPHDTVSLAINLLDGRVINDYIHVLGR